MSTIDISLGFRHISASELRNYANLGLIVAGNVDLTEFCNKLLEDMHSQEDLDRALENCEEDVQGERSDWCSECEAELN